MNDYDILHGKLPSPINKIKNSNINLTLKEENINLKSGNKKLKQIKRLFIM